jgi:hypothetical protein
LTLKLTKVLLNLILVSLIKLNIDKETETKRMAETPTCFWQRKQHGISGR